MKWLTDLKNYENVNIINIFSISGFYHKPLGYCKFLSRNMFLC